ncbi:MAG: AtpZ/AtpI family protein [Vampirovibrio sp.]|nr:AtpZ/AtpI family protein [Vampirovibrio sp.]
MDSAIQLLVLTAGGLMLGVWLNQEFGLPPIWILVLAILGMVAGIGILYKNALMMTSGQPKPNTKPIRRRPPGLDPNEGETLQDILGEEYLKIDDDGPVTRDELETIDSDANHDQHNNESDNAKDDDNWISRL